MSVKVKKRKKVGAHVERQSPPESAGDDPPIRRFSVLLTDLRSLQIRELYPKLTAKLQTDLAEAGDKRLKALIAEASEDKRIARMIYAHARNHREQTKDRWDVAMGGWMLKGRATLAGLKKKKEWEGQIYSADVDRWILANIPEALLLKDVVNEAENIYQTARALWVAYETRLSALQSYAKLREIRIRLDLEEMGRKPGKQSTF